PAFSCRRLPAPGRDPAPHPGTARAVPLRRRLLAQPVAPLSVGLPVESQLPVLVRSGPPVELPGAAAAGALRGFPAAYGGACAGVPDPPLVFSSHGGLGAALVAEVLQDRVDRRRAGRPSRGSA